MIAKADAVAAALRALPEAPTVFTTGFTARLADPHRPNHVPLTGAMGLALPVGIGIASASGQTTLVLDGDGSVLMNPAGLLALGAQPGLPVLHVVLDDGVYASTGGQPSPGGHVDLPALARAAGLRAYQASGAEELTDLLADLAERGGAATVRVGVVAQTLPPGPRVATPLPELARRFTEWVGEREHPGAPERPWERVGPPPPGTGPTRG